jgi:hypothetical protein
MKEDMRNKDIVCYLQYGTVTLFFWHRHTVTDHGLDWTGAVIRIMKGACAVGISLYIWDD